MIPVPLKSPRPKVQLLAKAILTLNLILGLSGCGDEADTVAAEAAGAQQTRRVINVGITTVQTQRFTDVIRLTGTVMADRTVTVAAQEGGIVEGILVDKGQSVRAGEPIVRLDDELLRAQRDAEQAQASLTRQLWERARQLFEEEGIGSENEYLQARYQAEQAGARLRLIETRLAHTQILAPFDGVLDTRHVEIGSLVTPGTPVATIVDLEPLKVTAGVPERYAPDVEVGARAIIIFDATADTGRAVVEFVGAVVHPGDRTFQVELALQTFATSIKPEMVASVILERNVLEDVVVVPREAMVRTEEGFVVFVAAVGAEDSDPEQVIAQRRVVALGPSANNEVVVTAGLHAHDRLVVLGQTQIADGDHLRIVSQR